MSKHTELADRLNKAIDLPETALCIEAYAIAKAIRALDSEQSTQPAAAAVPNAMEPAGWQYRYKRDRMGWSDWRDWHNEHQNPMIGHWQAEYRQIFAAAPSPEKAP